MAKDIEIEVKVTGLNNLRKELKQAKDDFEEMQKGDILDQSKIQSATKKINELKDAIGDMNDEITSERFDAVSKSLDDVKKKTEDNTKATKSLAAGFNGVALATKAMGIGLLISGLNILKDIFMKNEKVAKLVATAMETISIVFNEVVSVVVDVVEKVNKSSNGFEHLGKVIKGLLTLSFTPLKLAFYSIKLAVEEFRLAWEESVFGDGDTKVIADLNKRITATRESIVSTGKDALKAGIDVATNFMGAVDEIGQVVEGSIDGISKISISGAIAQAKANVDAKNNAIIAAAEQQRLIEIYDRQAEKLRQIRDDDSLSISERIKSNDDLAIVLDKQQAAMLKQADLQIQAAKIEEGKNKTAEATAAVIDAQANKEAILAQIEGFRSEQLANKNALLKEEITLQQTLIDGDTKRAIDNTKFNNSLIKDTTDRLEAERNAIKEEARLEEERLTKKRDTYQKGTQAYADAQQEILNLQQTTNQALVMNEIATKTATSEENKKKIELIKGDNTLAFEDRFAALNDELLIINETKYDSDIDRTNAIAANTEARNAMEIEFENKKNEAIGISKQNLTNIVSGLEEMGLAKTKAGQVIAKTIALTQIGIDSAVAISKASTLANAEGVAAQLAFPTVPGAGTIARVASYASTVISVAANIAKAKKLLSSGGSGAGGSSTPAGGGSAPVQPSFNLVGGANRGNEATSTKTVENNVNNNTQPIVVNAVVSETQVTDTQNRVRRIQDNAEL